MQMKRYPSSSSSSSSCVESHPTDHHKSDRPTPTKRTRAEKNLNPDNSQTNAQSQNSIKLRTSIYRGVTRHRWTGKFEAHLWDKNTWNTKQNKKGRQIYLGAYEDEEAAAHTYDLAAIKYWGPNTTLNFPYDTYTTELSQLENMPKEEYLASLRRRSSGFSRGVSQYRGVARHHHNGRWEARIGRVYGNKYMYLGTYNTQEEAAKAYDLAAIEYRGVNAVTNFDISAYPDCLKKKNLLKQDQPQEPTDANSTTETQPPEQQQQEEDQEIAPFTINSTTPMLVMDPTDEHEHPWNLCLDIGFDPFLISNIPLERTSELSDLFDENGFENDIDLIFDEQDNGIDFDVSGMVELDNVDCGVKPNALLGEEEKGQKRLTSPSFVSSSS